MSLNPFQSISKRRKIAQTNEAGRSITPDGLKQLSDSVFELYKPESIAVGSEVVFIHGLEHGNCGDAYWKTWLARDGTPNNVWPRTWLPDEFPSAHVFSLSYDACIEQTTTDGRMDLYVLGENLVQEMVEFGGIGQNGVPVVFVCHGFAGKLLKTRAAPKEGEEMVHPDSGFFSCGAACNFSTAIAATKCPKHRKPMITPIKMVEDAPVDPSDQKAVAAAQKEGGYVKPETKFMVTNQLEIFASSSMKALIALEMIRSERVGDLDTMEILVNAEEVLQLLKASLGSAAFPEHLR